MSACNAGDQGSIPGSGRSPGEGNGKPLQYSCLENPTDGENWSIHGYSSWGRKELDITEWLHFLSLAVIKWRCRKIIKWKMGLKKVKFKHFIKQCITYCHFCQIAIYLCVCISSSIYVSIYLCIYMPLYLITIR